MTWHSLFLCFSVAKDIQMSRICLLLAGLIIYCTSLNAQTAVGVRVSPDGLGITGQIPIKNSYVLEGQANSGGMFGSTGKSFTLVGLVKSNIPLPYEGWRFYFGLGGHAGVWDPGYIYDGDQLILKQGEINTMVGLDGIAGIEYRLKGSPVSISADYKPAVNLGANADYFPHNSFGVTARLYLQ